MCLAPLTRKRGVSKLLQTLTNGEDQVLTLYNNFTLVYCTFPDNLSLAAPPANIFLFLQLQMAYKVMSCVISSRLSLLGYFPYIQEAYIVLNFCLLSSLYCAMPRCSVLPDSVTPWTVAPHASLSMGILQARILEWVAMPFSRGSFQPRDRTQVSFISEKFCTV